MADSAAFQNYLKNPLMFPDTFKSWISDYFATNLPKLPISQVYGFKVQSVKSASATTSTYSTTSTSFVDVGSPSLSNIPNGFYIAVFGASVQAGAGLGGPTFTLGLSLDGAAPTTDNQAPFKSAGEGNNISGGRMTLNDLSQGDGSHSAKLQFKTTSGTLQILQPWLHLLKVVTE